MSDDNSRLPTYVVCRCQNCDGHIEFDASDFDSGETRTVECPHCHLKTNIFVSPKEESQPTEPATLSTSQSLNETKPCPFCAETIKFEAVVCRFCGRDLISRPTAPIHQVQTFTPEQPVTVVQAKSGVMDGVNIGCGMFIILPLILIGIGILVLIALAIFAPSVLR